MKVFSILKLTTLWVQLSIFVRNWQSLRGSCPWLYVVAVRSTMDNFLHLSKIYNPPASGGTAVMLLLKCREMNHIQSQRVVRLASSCEVGTRWVRAHTSQHLWWLSGAMSKPWVSPQPPSVLLFLTKVGALTLFLLQVTSGPWPT